VNPYEVLGVRKNASSTTIKAAYRKLSKTHHPDKGGDPEEFRQISLAYEVLKDPARRKRYDDTGRVDKSPASPERVRIFLKAQMKSVIDAQRQDGSSDDPVWENIRDKIILSITAARAEIRNNRSKIQRKLERTVRMIERFKPKQEDDPIGDILKEEKANLEGELKTQDDAMELSLEVEKVFRTYTYEVGPGPEGHVSPGPTLRLSGLRYRPSSPMPGRQEF
jgi:curved DNA-binding protein CbpA